MSKYSSPLKDQLLPDAGIIWTIKEYVLKGFRNTGAGDSRAPLTRRGAPVSSK